MRAYLDRYIHELTVAAIETILEKGAWQTGYQAITSAVTNDNDLKEPEAKWLAMGENTAGINAFFDIKFDNKVKRILDVGGGKFDCNRDYMKRTRNIELLIWDPYNRSHSHNAWVQAEVTANKVDAVTSMSVLNVIPEPEVRLAHITTLKTALLIGGKAYFKIWPGEFPLQGSYLSSATDSCYQANAYADRFVREIEIVFGSGNVVLDKTVPNLIVAVKRTDALTHRHDIYRIQKKSENELLVLTKIRGKAIDSFCSRNNMFRLFSANQSFFKMMEDEFLDKNRHAEPQVQHEYDKRFGLVPYKFS